MNINKLRLSFTVAFLLSAVSGWTLPVLAEEDPPPPDEDSIFILRKLSY